MAQIGIALVSAALIGTVLWDAFETIILPRSIVRRFRLARAWVRAIWFPWRLIARRVRPAAGERFLAIFGPIALLGLIALWAICLIIGFAGLHWAAGSRLEPIGAIARFSDDLYMSGTTFTTLGLGDLHPVGRVARLLTVVEAATGFAFFAIVVAYLPVLYQSFSRREAQLTLLDAWAGSPPAAAEVLRRLAARSELSMLGAFLKDWEFWCSDVLESHISYPTVSFFRSQHQKQSWVSALACLLDLSALIEVGIDGIPSWQAHVTFAIARHTAVDLAQVFRVPIAAGEERLRDAEFDRMRDQLAVVGVRLVDTPASRERLRALRRSYEPYLFGLSRMLMMPLPPWWNERQPKDNWQTSPRGVADAHF
jgi:Ion channel